MNELTKESALAERAKALAASCGITYSEALTTILQIPPENTHKKGGKKILKLPAVPDFLASQGYSVVEYDPHLLPKNKIIQEFLSYCAKQGMETLPTMQAVDKLLLKSGLGETSKDGRSYYTFIETNQF